MHHDGVHRAFNIGQQALGRNQAGVHAQLDAARHALGDAQQLDAVTELLGIADVLRSQVRDAFNMCLVELHRNAKGNRAHDRGLVRRVHAFDVKGGVGFGVTQGLRFFQHHVKVQALVAHLGQDEVGRAVDDAGNPLNGVGAQAFAQRLDDGNAAGHGRLEGHHDALALGGRENFGAMHGQQRLVGGDHMLAGLNGFEHQRLGNAVAANQFDHDINVGAGDDLARVINHLHALAHQRLGARHVQVGHHGDLNATAGAPANLFLVALEHVEGAAAHGANAQKAYPDGAQIRRRFKGHLKILPVVVRGLPRPWREP